MAAKSTACSYCGAEVKAEQRFCTVCGQKMLVRTPGAQRGGVAKRPNWWHNLTILVVVVVFVACLICGAFAALGEWVAPDRQEQIVEGISAEPGMAESTGTPAWTKVPGSTESTWTPTPTKVVKPSLPGGTQIKVVGYDGDSITTWHFDEDCRRGNALGQLAPGADAHVLDNACLHRDQQMLYYQVALADGTICWVRELELVPAIEYTPLATDTPEPTNTPTATPTPEPTATPAHVEAQVSRVIDGDTIEVVSEGQTYKVRYIGIDTPETVHPDKPVEWMGPEATTANKELVEGEVVYLEKDVSETDQYGRLLRYVFLVDGTFVNAELVRLGYAQVSTYPPDVKYQDLFLQMQDEARENQRGLWSPEPAPSPLPTVPPATDTPVPPTSPPPTTQPSPTPAPSPIPVDKVVISHIFYDGVVYRVESDEYAEIRNEGTAAVNLAGWRLNAGDPGQDFLFPDFVLESGQACRVYTNEYHPEHCGFSFGSGQALWNNTDKDCGYLYDAAGNLVSTHCY